MSYPIFISYRRVGGFEAAKMIQEKLKSLGYNVFLDFEELRSGKFNEALYTVIENCNDFILILSPGCLDRCEKEDDWLRLEIEHALKLGKNIVPVRLRGFEFPKNMPAGLEGLELHNAISASEEFFDAFIQKLQKFLKTKPKRINKVNRLVILATLAIILLVVGLIAYDNYSRHRQLEQVSKAIVTDVGLKMVNLNNILSNSDAAIKQWQTFNLSAHNPVFAYDTLKKDFLNYMNFIIRSVDTVNTKILSEKYREVISRSNIPLEDVEAFYNSAYRMAVEDGRSVFKNMNEMVKPLPKNGWFDLCDDNFGLRSQLLDHHYYNIFYSLLALIDDMPKKSKSHFYSKVVPLLTNFPNTGILSKEEAISMAEKELQQLEQGTIDLAMLTGNAQKEMELFYKKLERLKVEQEHINLKAQKVERLKEEIKGKDVLISQGLDNIRKKCLPVDGDDEYMVWGKMLRLLATNLKTEALENLNHYEKMNLDKGMDVSYYTNQVRKFIIQELHLNYNGGVVVFAFQDNREHSVLKPGDIIVEIGGEEVINADDFTTLRKKNDEESEAMGVVRWMGGEFQKIELKSMKSDPLIGIMELMEKLE